MGTATRLSPTPAPPAPSRGDAGVRTRAASQNSACLHQSLAGSKEGAFYFSRQEPSRAFADARLEEGMLILFRTLRQPRLPLHARNTLGFSQLGPGSVPSGRCRLWCK